MSKGFRIIGIICALLVVAIIVLWFMIAERSGRISQLNSFAAAGNANAPRMIDDVTRLEGVSVEYPAVVFHYTFVVPADMVDLTLLESRERLWFQEDACANEQVMATVLEPGYEIVRSYQDSQQNVVLQLRLGIEQCQPGT